MSDYTLEELWQENEYRAVAVLSSNIPDEQLAGFLKFCEEYVHIRHPEFGRIKFTPFEAQVEAVASWLSCRYSLVLKARQIGFSTLVAVYALWNAAFHPDRPILMLSRTEREAIKLLQKAKYALPVPARVDAVPHRPDECDADEDGVLERLLHRVVAVGVRPGPW